MQDYDADVIVMGGGPGGYIAAERLGQAGRRVMLIEAEALGGTCLNVGCIPTKTLLNGAKTLVHAREGARFGVHGEVSLDWGELQAWKRNVVSTLVAGVGATEKKAGVDVIQGEAVLEGPGRVRVGDLRFTCEHVIVATGSVPVMPPIPGADSPQVVDSTGLLAIESIPERLAIIGGGVIGVEFASLFAALGSQVDVIEMLPEIVPAMDADLAALLRSAIPATFHLASRVTSIDGGTVHLTDADGTARTIEADVILMAVGRAPKVHGWGAQEAGLHVERGVVVDDRMRTNLPNVWAVGDVTGRSLLAHAAYRMGEVAAANICDPNAHRTGQVMRWHTVPWAVYSLPEAAGIGLTESAAHKAGYQVVSARVPAYMSGRFVAEEGTSAPGAAKIIADATTRRILGMHVVGPYASEMIWGASAVLEMEMSIDDLRQMVIPHPTVSEVLREAAWALKA